MCKIIPFPQKINNEDEIKACKNRQNELEKIIFEKCHEEIDELMALDEKILYLTGEMKQV